MDILNTIEPFYLFIWIGLIIGVFYSYKEYGRLQYAEGMSDAICMHHTGSLVYKVVTDENGEEDIEIKINGG
jgi:hypothetical protein